MAAHEAAAPPASVDDALEDVAMRFLANLPVEEKAAFFAERLFFQLQQAHWFYEDFFVDDLDHIPHMRFREFTTAMFERCALLEAYTARHDDFLDLFKEYSASIPSFGAFVLNPSMTKVLLVQSFRGKSWGLPKGKINEGETELQCAVREVAEETGVDILPFARAEDFVAYYNGGQLVKMFIARGVPSSTKAAPQTRKEIKRAEWHDVASIPIRSGTTGASRYWTVRPMMRDLLKWIRRQKGGKRAAKGGGGGGGGGGSVDRAGASARGKHSRAAKRKAAKAASAGLTAAGAPSGSKKSGKRRARDDGPSGAAAGGSAEHSATFGADAGVGWSVADMFRANAELLDVKFRYDGNPQTFGSPSEEATPLSGEGRRGRKRKGTKAKGGGGGAKGSGNSSAPRRKGRGSGAAGTPSGGSGGGQARRSRQRRDSFDADDHEATFGAGSGGGWTAADMFKANAMLGVDYTYDGDPQTFGDPSFARSRLSRPAAAETKSRSRTSDDDDGAPEDCHDRDESRSPTDEGDDGDDDDDDDDDAVGDDDIDDDDVDDEDEDDDDSTGGEESDAPAPPAVFAMPVTAPPAGLSPDDPVAGMWAFEPDLALVMAAFSEALSPKSRDYLVRS